MATALRQELIKIATSGYGRANADRLVEIIIQRPELFTELIEIYFANEEPASRRIVWAIDLYAETYPEALFPFIDKIVDHLPEFNHDGLKRHSLRMLARSPLPEANQGQLITICFDFLLSSSETPAVKVYAMETLYRISIKEPALKQELIDSIEWRAEEESAGVRNRGQKILKRLYQELNS